MSSRPITGPIMGTRLLVVAKAPVAGEAKTRLAATIGAEQAAEVAAAALLDTLQTVAAAAGPTPVLALVGDLAMAARGNELSAIVRDWQVVPQRGGGFAARLANAHADTGAIGPEPVLQIGMDTPQISVDHLAQMANALAQSDAVLGPAEDGGWWVLGLHDPSRAALLRGVPMSTSETAAVTRRVLETAGLSVGTGPVLRDVDELADAESVALQCAGDSHFAATWAGLTGQQR